MKSPWIPALLIALAITAPAAANIIVVDTLDDEHTTDGDCSLREAIAGANTDTKVDACTKGLGADLIFISVTGTIQTPTLTGLPTITDGVEILGNDQLTIDGRGAAPIFAVDMTNDAHDFTLAGNGMVLRRGRAVGRGGGALYLINGDEAIVRDVIFEKNRACDLLVDGLHCGSSEENRSGLGGAIGFSTESGKVWWTFVVERSWFLGNSATLIGGGIGISGTATSISISDSVFAGNVARHQGGGMYVHAGPVSISGTRFVANRAASGAAFAVDANNDPEWLTLVNSLIVDNEALGFPSGGPAAGGASVTGRPVAVSFTTIARNRAPEGGWGGLYTGGAATRFTHAAITDNYPRDCGLVTSGAFSLGHNLDSDGTCVFDEASDLPAGSALMGGLGTFAGEPWTALPSSHSPLVDGGADSCVDVDGNPITADILGNPRPADGRASGTAACDIGAIEAQAPYDFLFGDGFEAGTTAAWN